MYLTIDSPLAIMTSNACLVDSRLTAHQIIMIGNWTFLILIMIFVYIATHSIHFS